MNMTLLRYKKLLLCIVLLLILLLVAYPVRVLTIHAGNQRVRSVTGIKDGFVLSYVHSLYSVPQQEVYSIKDGFFVLEEMRFGSLEAVNYYNFTNSKVYRDGWWVQQENGKSYREVVLRVPFYNEQYIYTKNSVVVMSRVAEPGSRVILKIEVRHLLPLIIERGITWILRD